jgi:hypothetical protein
MNKQASLWVFQKGVHISHTIILQVGSWSMPTVMKTINDDTLIYTIDYDTYNKWNSWYSLKAKEIVQNNPAKEFERVMVFDANFYSELANLDCP